MTDINLSFENEAPQEQPRGFRLGLGSIVLLAGVVLTAVVFGFALAQRNSQVQPQSGPAPDFTLTTLQGETYRLADLKGQVVVVNFWASWCVPCKVEAPELERVWQKYKDQGVIMLGIAYTDTERGARAFIQEYNQTYPNGLDLETRISERYHITGVPETFVINQKGEVVAFHPEPLDEARLSAIIDRVLTTGA